MKASVSARNLAGIYIEVFTGTLISHTAQNHPVDLVMIAFLCLEVCYNG